MQARTTDVSLGQRENRPIRCTLLLENGLLQTWDPEIEALANNLNIDVRTYEDGLANEEYDVIGLLEPKRSAELERWLRQKESLKISFVNSVGRIQASRLKNIEAAVICKSESNQSVSALKVIHSFFDSLLVPSLFNIDLADVRSIAKGIGISFTESGSSYHEILEKLPRECYVARSTLLHYSCTKDVTLNEIYEITKAISIKRPDGGRRENGRPPNVKMGLRVVDGSESQESKRIRLIAILFGV